ncbi:glycosyltransferase [Haloarcula sp. CBA1131]|nr:glycosyltransferase [Haloarcula sp. CBA1131]
MTSASVGAEPDLAFYIPNLTVGGAEQVTVNIVNGLAGRGYDVELVVSHPGGELRTAVADSVAVIELADVRIPGIGIGAHLHKLAQYLGDTEPDILISEKTDANILCLGAKRVAESTTTVVPTEHIAFGMMPDESLKSRGVRKVAAQLYPAANDLIAVSDGVADSLGEKTAVDRGDISVLHNPVEITTVQDRAHEPVSHKWIEDTDTDVLLFVGRHHPQKDLKTWLRSFKRVNDTLPDTRAVIAGRGSETETVRELTVELGLTEVTSIPGYVDNPYRFMNQASLFLLSSQFEGLPTVLIEAMACGCPIVSTDCPSGPREILADGEYGRLTPVGDVDSIATAALEMLENPTPAAVLQDRAADFAPQTVLNDYEQFIETRLG